MTRSREIGTDWQIVKIARWYFISQPFLARDFPSNQEENP